MALKPNITHQRSTNKLMSVLVTFAQFAEGSWRSSPKYYLLHKIPKCIQFVLQEAFQYTVLVQALLTNKKEKGKHISND